MTDQPDLLHTHPAAEFPIGPCPGCDHRYFQVDESHTWTARDRAQAAADGVDMLIAQAERRGAVKALRAALPACRPIEREYLGNYADGIENGADL